MSSNSIPEPRKGNFPASKLILTVAAVALAALLLYYSLRGIDWHAVWALISGAKPAYLVLCCSISTAALFLRAMRWRILLGASGRVGASDAFWATSVGYFGNNFLPARAGEIARTVAISSSSGLSKGFVLTTALLERMVDAVALVVISTLVVWMIPEPPKWLAAASKPFAIIGGCGILAIALLPLLENTGLKILDRLPIPHAIRPRLAKLLSQVLEGARAFHDIRRLAGFLGLTIVIWCLDATITVFCSASIGLVISWPAAFLLVAALGLGSALPSTPGYVGIYQFVAISVLTPFGLSRTNAIAYILLWQALNYLVVALWGGIGVWKSTRRNARAAESAPHSQALEASQG